MLQYIPLKTTSKFGLINERLGMYKAFMCI